MRLSMAKTLAAATTALTALAHVSVAQEVKWKRPAYAERV